MRIWALGDLHLSFGIPNKSMDVFGVAWKNHAKQIEEAWIRLIHKDDLVLLPGDISWAMRLEEALPDLLWIDKLPGTKVLLKGNHDFWWGSLKKIAGILPPSLHLIQNNSFHWKEAAIGGARLWDTAEYSFGPFIDFVENPRERPKDFESNSQSIEEDLSEKIFERELSRLETSLSTLSPHAKLRIAMTHYPPIGPDLQPSRASRILEKHGIQLVVFGHLHNVKAGLLPFGEKNGVRYILASGDYVRFQPVLLL